MKKILVIQNKRIGDVFLATIIPNNLKKIFPDCHISFLCYDYAAPVLQNNPNIDNVLAIDEKKLKQFHNLLRLGWGFRCKKYDILIDPYVKFQSQFLSLLSRAEKRIGYSKKTLPFAYTKKIPLLEKGISRYGKAIDDRINLIRHFQPEMEFDVHPKLFLTEGEKAEGREKLKNLDRSKKTLMFGVLGSDNSKSLPIDYVVELLDHLGSQHNFNILLNYTPSQREIIEQILQKTKNKAAIHPDIVAGDIREFAKIMFHCDLLVANEGGSVHLTKSLGKPTFAVYSPYIAKATWATFENNPKHCSIHLKEARPDLFKNKSRKEIKESAMELYESFTPKLIIPRLDAFLTRYGG